MTRSVRYFGCSLLVSLSTSISADFVHVFKLEEDEGAPDTDEAQDGSVVNACEVLLLPNTHLDGIWETLMYDDSVKSNLLNYVSTIMMFSDRGVDPNIVSFNRYALVSHAPFSR
jgi:pachytene checkpoint protein 2